MAATKQDIRSWLDRGKKEGASHLIVVCDTFDYDDYPVYVMPGDDAHEAFTKYNGVNMQKVMEVYSFSLDLEAQLNEHRAFHF